MKLSAAEKKEQEAILDELVRLAQEDGEYDAWRPTYTYSKLPHDRPIPKA